MVTFSLIQTMAIYSIFKLCNMRVFDKMLNNVSANAI